MNIGRCECPVGLDGFPCFHKYLLWSKQIASNFNFVPKFDEKARQKFAMIALRKTLNQEFYKPLHTPLLKRSLDCLEYEKPEPESTSESTWSNKINKDDSTLDKGNSVFDELDKAFAFFRQKAGQGNKDLDKGLLTFTKRVHRLSENQLISALHSFGGSFVSKSRRRIQVQPGSVPRRKSKIGGRQKQDTRGSGLSLDLPVRSITTKRKHCFSSVTNSNKPSAKKAGRTMNSMTKHFKSKQKKMQS